VVEHPDDLALAQRLAAGDSAAFTLVFETYFPRLYRFALGRLSGDADQAEEATQRCLCRAVRRFDSYRGEASLFTWLCQICRHEIADLLETLHRDQSRFASPDEDPELRAHLESLAANASSDPLALADQKDRSRMVQLVLDHLPARYGDVLEWKYIEGIRVEEIAQRLQVTPLAAESALARARRAFRGAWQSVSGESFPEPDFAGGARQ
jgi:RNA polymerase sigma-70 factor (ECF subfamily)